MEGRCSGVSECRLHCKQQLLPGHQIVTRHDLSPTTCAAALCYEPSTRHQALRHRASPSPPIMSRACLPSKPNALMMHVGTAPQQDASSSLLIPGLRESHQVPADITHAACDLNGHAGKIYHLTFSPPETDVIRARLTARADDTEEKVKVRSCSLIGGAARMLCVLALPMEVTRVSRQRRLFRTHLAMTGNSMSVGRTVPSPSGPAVQLHGV